MNKDNFFLTYLEILPTNFIQFIIEFFVWFLLNLNMNKIITETLMHMWTIG